MTVCCECEDCLNLRILLEINAEPIPYKGFRILTEHELALLDFPWPPEPE